MPVCFSCSKDLPDRATYCPSCAIQVRCINKDYRDMLERNARACVSCGTRISDGIEPVGNGTPTGFSSAVNVLTFDETTKSRSLSAHLTDAAVDSLSNALSQFMTGNRSDRRVKTILPAFLPQDQQPLLPGISDGHSSLEVITLVPEQTAGAQPAAPTNSDEERVMQFFRCAGDQLHLEEPRIKAENKLDYARRLTYLFLYAHFLQNRDRVPRAELYAQLSTSTVDDNNTRTWIRKNASLVKDGELIGLNSKGRADAKIVLNEALDENRQPDWLPGTERAHSKTNSTGVVAKRSSKLSGSKAGRPNLAKDWATKWKAQTPPVNAHSILAKRTVADKGIFALWAIRELVGEAGKIVSGSRLANFILEAFEFKIHIRTLQKALESKATAGKVLKLDSRYQLQPPGIEYAKQMAKGATVTSATKK